MDFVLNNNIEGMHKFSALPYFKNLVNDETEEGWTAILAATARPSDIGHKCINF